MSLWTGDRLAARPLPVECSTTKKNATNIHNLSRIPIQNPSVREDKDIADLKQRGIYDLPVLYSCVPPSMLTDSKGILFHLKQSCLPG
jgi:hypothetical protein